MAYFANGTEGEFFRESFCYNCANWRRKENEGAEGCPIMDVHFLYSYELCNSRSKAKEILDTLITKDKQCSMYLFDEKKYEENNTEKLF